jgi:hypothetical protein
MSILSWLLKPKRKTRWGTVDYNAKKMRRQYPLDRNGYFGTKAKNSQVIYSENHIKDARSFFYKLGAGGKKKNLSNGRGIQKTMTDGGIVVYREKTTTPNSPAVDLNKMTGIVKNQKIHFIRKGKNGK